MSRDNLQKLILQILADTPQDEKVSDQALVVRAVRALKQQSPEEVANRKVAPRYVIKRTIKRMYTNGIIESEDIEEQKFMYITDEGMGKLSRMQGYEHLVDQSVSWDGKWRMVILNFSEDQKTIRESVRRILKEIGFVSIKSSVWAFPYDTTELIQALREEFDIQHELICIVADSIDQDIA